MSSTCTHVWYLRVSRGGARPGSLLGALQAGQPLAAPCPAGGPPAHMYFPPLAHMYLRIWKTRPGQAAACAGRHSLHMPAPCACVHCRQYWLFSFFFTAPFLTLPGWQRQPWCSNSAAVKRPESQGSGPCARGSGGGSGSAASPQPGSGSTPPPQPGSGSAARLPASAAAAVEGRLSTTTQPGAPAESQASPLSLGPAALAWSCLALHTGGRKYDGQVR